MRKMNRTLPWIACLSVFLMSNAAIGGSTNLVCPSDANAGSNVEVILTIENSECRATTLRVMSSIVGNAGGTLAGIGIFGPVVVEPLVVVPAGTDTFCGCNAGTCQCDFPFVSCSTDADCQECGAFIPGTLDLPVTVEPALPSSLAGTVATVLLISEPEADSASAMSINECFVEVL